MLIVITGTPGTGKTTIANKIGEKIGFEVINEKEFALKHKIGEFNKLNELEIDLNELKQQLMKKINSTKNLILEGHLLCEIKLPADTCIVLTTKTKTLEKRLKKRKYTDEKILDNIYCEETKYCLNKTKKNYLYIINVDSSNSTISTFNKILFKLNEKFGLV